MENAIELAGFLGLFCGMMRVIPQTILTISSQDITHLSFLFFFMHFLAGVCGMLYEVITNSFNPPHILFFGMVIFTNAIQITYMLYIKLLKAPEGLSIKQSSEQTLSKKN